MKFLIPLLILTAPLHAELLATIHTTQGNVEVALQYNKAPLAVANFIGLAQGTRSWFDEETGAVVRKPFYVGEKFYRVFNDAGFKIAQTGSGNGTASGGPGYKFRDEFDDSLQHVPYVLSMANGGPNTNGSQIFLTGNVSISHLNKVHTVFGLVSDEDSQGVIDAIMAAGNDGTTINSISFSRTDTAAVAFDENGQALLRCSAVPGSLTVKKSLISYDVGISRPIDSLFRVYTTHDLMNWSYFGGLLEQFEDAEPGLPITFGIPTLPRQFYNISLTTFPNALWQNALAGRTMETKLSDSRTRVLTFNSPDSQTGTFTDTDFPEQTFNFTVNNHSPHAYGADLIIYTPSFVYYRIVCGYDSENDGAIVGRNSTSILSGGDWIPIGSGTLTLSKP